jgi:hypothetical protein
MRCRRLTVTAESCQMSGVFAKSSDGHPKADNSMADLQRLLFDSKATINDREVLAAARLSASVKAFAGCELSESTLEEVNTAILDEIARLIKEGVLTERPDWLAVVVQRRLHVAFGAKAVQQLSRELRTMGF